MTEEELKAGYAAARKRLMSGKPVQKALQLPTSHPARDRMVNLIHRAKNIPKKHKPIKFRIVFRTPALSSNDPDLPKWKRIALMVCEDRGVTLPEIIGGSRSTHIARARHEIIYRLATETDMSLTAIGRRLNRHHTSCLHAARMHAKRNDMMNPFQFQDRERTGRSSRLPPKSVIPKPDLDAWHKLGETYQQSLQAFTDGVN